MSKLWFAQLTILRRYLRDDNVMYSLRVIIHIQYAGVGEVRGHLVTVHVG